MLPLRTALRGSQATSTRSIRSLSLTARLPIATSSSRPSSVALAASRSLHATSSKRKDEKKWINPSSLDGAKDGEQRDRRKDKGKGKQVEADEAASKSVEKDSGDGSSAPLDSAGQTVASSSRAPTDPSTKQDGKVASSSSSSSPSSSSPASSPPSSSSSASQPPDNGGKSGKAATLPHAGEENAQSKTSKEVAKVSIPEVYPQVLALPITRRPLFPGECSQDLPQMIGRQLTISRWHTSVSGFYKAVTITSPPVIQAIRTLLQRGQPYIGAFLLKDSESDSDVITSMDQVYPVGVFAQITSVFGSGDAHATVGKVVGEGAEGEKKPEKETLTAVLFPHRRIRIDELLTERPPGTGFEAPAGEVSVASTTPVTEPEPSKQAEVAKPESEVASFELEETPTSEQVKKDLGDAAEKASSAEESARPPSNISFLHPLLPNISLTNVSNLQIEPFKRDSQMIRAVMNELLSVFKDIAQLAPIFREQSESQLLRVVQFCL
jgi:Lon-like ATP-dependent protease